MIGQCVQTRNDSETPQGEMGDFLRLRGVSASSVSPGDDHGADAKAGTDDVHPVTHHRRAQSQTRGAL